MSRPHTYAGEKNLNVEWEQNAVVALLTHGRYTRGMQEDYRLHTERFGSPSEKVNIMAAISKFNKMTYRWFG